MAKKKKGGTSKGKQQSDSIKNKLRRVKGYGDAGLITDKTVNTFKPDSIK